jgi:hypothetical protein
VGSANAAQTPQKTTATIKTRLRERILSNDSAQAARGKGNRHGTEGELRESYRWLRLIQRVPLLRPKLVEPLTEETDELIRIFVKSVKTAKSKAR